MELKKIRKASGKTQGEIAKAIGVTQTTYSRYENGQSEMGHATLKKLSKYFGVTIDELLSEPSSDPIGRKIVTKPVPVFEETLYIPLVPSLRCGYGRAVEDLDVIKKFPVPSSYKRFGEIIVAVTAKGDSMAPTIPVGSFMICSIGSAWEDGNIVAVTVNDADTVKRIYHTEDGGIKLVPDNPEYKTISYSALGRIRKLISQDL